MNYAVEMRFHDGEDWSVTALAYDKNKAQKLCSQLEETALMKLMDIQYRIIPAKDKRPSRWRAA